MAERFNMASATDKEIFIKILNEDINVWRPVKAVQIAQYIFKITDTTKFESELDEILEFKQGDIVKCREKDGDSMLLSYYKNPPYK